MIGIVTGIAVMLCVFFIGAQICNVHVPTGTSTSKLNACRLPQMTCIHFLQHAGVKQVPGTLKYIWDPCANRLCTPGSTGNVLSRYWNTRAMLHFAGAEFEVGPNIARMLQQTSFLKFLPFHSPAPPCPDGNAYISGCLGCSMAGNYAFLYDFPALCNGAWSLFRHIIRNETKRALLQWHTMSQTPIPALGMNYVAVQYRCAADTLNADGYGPMGYSCYDQIPKSAKLILIILSSLNYGPCMKMAIDLKRHISTSRPSANVSFLSGSAEHDFSVMAHASVLVRHGQSTFGLWAGLTGSEIVFSLPLPSTSALNTTPDLGATWVWRKCPILSPAVAKQANIHSPESMIKWARQN